MWMILVILLLFLYLCSGPDLIEGYGPVKSFKRLPQGDCKSKCDAMYQSCLLENPLASYVCNSRYSGCLGMCNESVWVSGGRY